MMLTMGLKIPGLVMFADETDVLERGHWPSYNVPFFKEIYEESGCLKLHLFAIWCAEHSHADPGMVEKHGLGNSYQMAPRAQVGSEHDMIRRF